MNWPNDIREYLTIGRVDKQKLSQESVKELKGPNTRFAYGRTSN